MKSKSAGMDFAKYGYRFSIPFITAFLLFNLYPTVYTLFLGFTNRKGLIQVGELKVLDHPFDNFKEVFSNPTFTISLKNTIQIWIMNFIPQIVIALLLTAWFTSHAVDLKGKGFFKVVFYMPNIITAATVAILFNALFAYPVGPANDFLNMLGKESYFFVNKPKAARLIVAFIQFWQWYGNSMIVLISGVLGISPDIYEAAEIDGANGVQTFFKITIPNLKTVLLYSLVTSLVGGLNMYDIPKCFRNGGPNNATLTTNVYIYNQAFSGSYMLNKAAAASMIMFVIIAICSAVLFYIMRDKDEAKLEKQKREARKNARRA